MKTGRFLPLDGGGSRWGCEKHSARIKSNARILRKNTTDTEKFLWKYLRNKQFEGIKFRRQQPISRYIVDFVSFEKRLIIEVDGGQHVENAGSDKIRDDCFTKQGYKVLRFWDNEIFTNIEGVLEVIRQELINPSP